MRFGKNMEGLRICATDAQKGSTYTCPVCSKPLVLKQGAVIHPHFAHYPKQGCIDLWAYDESPWVQKQQSKFPEEYQEVYISCGGETHRADVAIGDDVILFVHEQITGKTFNEKTNFFQKAGKNVLWVIDAEQEYQIHMLRKNNRDKSMMFWDHPPAFLKKADIKANKHLFIFLSIEENKWRKVEWIAPDSGFERFIVDADFIPDLTSEAGCQEAKMNKYARFDDLKAKNMPWKKKTSSTNGAPDKRWHTCENTGTYHCDECKHCEYNLINEFRSANQKTGQAGGLFFYCCYPEAKHPVIADENGKGTAAVPSIWLK